MTITERRLPSELAVYDLQEAAYLAQASRWSLVGAIQAGDLKAHRSTVGPRGHWRINRDELLHWMRSAGIPLDIALRGRPRFGRPPPDFGART